MNSAPINPHTIDPNDHDAIHNFIANITDKELEKMQDILAYFFPIWAGNRIKKRIMDDLVDEDRIFLFQSLLLISYTHGKKNAFNVQSNEQLNDLFSLPGEDDRKAINEIIIDVKNGNGQRIDELVCEFKKRTAAVRDVFIKRIEDYKYTHLPKKKRQQVENLRKATDKEDAISTIVASHYQDNEQVKILDEAVKTFDWIVGAVDLSVFTPRALQINESHVAHLVELVSNPICLLPQNAINVLREVDVPNSWYIYRSFTVSEYRDFCENMSDPKAWSYIINRICDNILKKIDVPIAPILARKKVINEIIESLYDRRFEIGMLSMYAEIEGLLWDFAIEIDRREEIFDKNDNARKTLIDVNSAFRFQSDRIRDVMERTAMKNHIDASFIKDFCEGIYEERNPILHGRQNCFATCSWNVSCIAQKLMAIEYILGLIIDEFQNNLFKQWDSMPSDVIERTVAAYEKLANV